ncbi:MAG: DUF433 domain-containing protein [Chlorobiaceae bacterium]|nr:DUF433 domain-containing protein [Chlorobiaceae bacterium]
MSSVNERMEKRITVNPDQCRGRPCIRGIRIQIIDILDLLASGLGPDEVLQELPDLEKENIHAALKYASRKLDHPVIEARPSGPMLIFPPGAGASGYQYSAPAGAFFLSP